jgi:hypothetical protein
MTFLTNRLQFGAALTIAAIAIFGFAASIEASSGATFTTDASCDGTNLNVFGDKDAVYLNGGPHHEGSAGLAEGDYYVQVTTPGGNLLGSTPGATVHVDATGSFENCYQLSAILQKASDASDGYDDTSNGGGVYKVWISSTADFANGTNKTDNFKVKDGEDNSCDPELGDCGNCDPETQSCGTEQQTKGVLHVVKNLPNDNGGTASADDFSFSVNGGAPISFEEDGNNDLLVESGIYTVEETNPMGGYAMTTANCTDVFVPVDGEVTCTITNDDIAPQLTLNKVVVNDNGGAAFATDWTLTATGATTLSGTTGVTSDEDFSVGTYSLSEDGDSHGYAASDWSCVVNGDEPVSGNSLSLDLADVATCTITNDDIAPKLTVKKHVDNDNWGTAQASAFTINVLGTSLNATSTFPGSESGTTITLDQAGSYAVSEVLVPGYTGALSSGCIGTLGIGDTAECTVTNTDNLGWMTGGGSIFAKSGDTPAMGTRVTHGFELGCTPTARKSNLEINWNIKGGKASDYFKLTGLTDVHCTIEAGVPQIHGTGTGLYKGKPGYTIEFTMTDAGEPGSVDKAKFKITAPISNAIIMDLTSLINLEQGNQQTHVN